MTELWRPIPSLPEYEASSLGRVRRVPYFAPMPRGGERQYGGIAWLGAWDETQRRYVLMFRGKTYRVAPLVCEAFNGPPPPGLICLHSDENSRNNQPGNLSWGTWKENMNAPGFLATARERPWLRNRLNGLKLTAADAKCIRENIAGKTQAALSKEFGVGQSMISAIINGRAWTHA